MVTIERLHPEDNIIRGWRIIDVSFEDLVLLQKQLGAMRSVFNHQIGFRGIAQGRSLRIPGQPQVVANPLRSQAQRFVLAFDSLDLMARALVEG
jgi:hypothetical protein